MRGAIPMRRRNRPSRIASIACAWFSTPKTVSPSGVATRSTSPRPVKPTTTSLPSSRDTSKEPSRIRRRGHEARRCRMPVVDVGPTVGLRGHGVVAKAQLDRPAEGRRHGKRCLQGNSNHLYRERGHRGLVESPDHLQSARHAALEIQTVEPVAGGAGVDLGDVAQVAGIGAQPLAHSSQETNGRRARRSGEARVARFERGHPEHRRHGGERLAQQCVIGGHALEPCRDVRRPVLELCGHGRGRIAVRFRKEDVHPDHERTPLRDTRDEVGDAIARPGPLPMRGERLLVDRDHDHLVGHAIARHKTLPAVEYQFAEALDRRRRDDEQQGKRGQQDEGGDAKRAGSAQGSISRPS